MLTTYSFAGIFLGSWRLSHLAFLVAVTNYNFSKADEDALGIEGIDLIPFDIPSGSYQVVYEYRFLEREEWGNYEGIRESPNVDLALDDPENPSPDDYYEFYPALCRFTFIPAIDPGPPQILKDIYNTWSLKS
ncbi:MAG: hypothetical protein HC886_22965 [Leptolyngbyaceae cyanobacterium SM1_1_3]|nr:hypothetical protein [Leptolyngbyaceae cyanobacterium SM1_1_3]